MLGLGLGINWNMRNRSSTSPVLPKYFVSYSEGDDSNDGLSSVTPWKTISKVNSSTFSPGDIIAFKKGDSWTGTITANNAGASGNPITVTSYGTGSKPIITSIVNTPAITVTAANRGYWTIDGLDIRATGFPSGFTQTLGIYFNYWEDDLGIVPGWTIKNCSFNCCILVSGPNTLIKDNIFNGTGNSNNKRGAIEIRGTNGDGAIIEGNIVLNYIDRGVWIYNGSPNVTIKNNIIHDISVGDDQNGAGINVDGASVVNSNAKIYGNTIYNCGYAISHENGFGGETYNNLIYDSITGMTIYTYSGEYSKALNLSIHHNIIYNVDKGIELWHSRDVIFANNILYKDNNIGNEKTGFSIYENNTNVSGLNFINNIISGTWNGYPFKIYFVGTAIWNSFDYNIIIPTGTTIYREFGNNRTLSYMQGVGLMIHGLTDDPLFIDAGNDFRLQLGSPAINAGADIGLTTDYDGKQIIGIPDIGAFEYS